MGELYQMIHEVWQQIQQSRNPTSVYNVGIQQNMFTTLQSIILYIENLAQWKPEKGCTF